MNNEAKTPNGASKEVKIVETEEEICPDMVLLATAFDVNEAKNKVETSRKESRIADSNMLKYLFENFQEVRLKGKESSKVKNTKNSKKVVSKQKKEIKEEKEEQEIEDKVATKRVRRVNPVSENKAQVTKKVIKKRSNDEHIEGRGQTNFQLK